MNLKIEAAMRRTSVSALIREQITNMKKSAKKKSISKILKEMDKIAADISKYTKGISLSEELIKMRYEQ